MRTGDASQNASRKRESLWLHDRLIPPNKPEAQRDLFTTYPSRTRDRLEYDNINKHRLWPGAMKVKRGGKENFMEGLLRSKHSKNKPPVGPKKPTAAVANMSIKSRLLDC